MLIRRKFFVTPYVGVWIETVEKILLDYEECVTPYVGVWIETSVYYYIKRHRVSLLMWECGLKQGGF